MDLMVALENGDTWTTKEGKTIKIPDLEDKHLLNIINMLMARAPLIKDRMFLEARRFRGLLHGDMAGMAADMDIEEIGGMDDIEALQSTPLYDALRKEAKKRGFKVD
jgi:hypothetical protein